LAASLGTRQKEILGLVGEGLSNAQIAERLFLSESTIRQHLRAAYKVLGVNNRTEAVRLIRSR
jgi:DNA-binding NarL/FixJ family response regulator